MQSLFVCISEDYKMLVERGVQVMNVEVVGAAYDIASYYLMQTGAIKDTSLVSNPLLEIIYDMFNRGDRNKIRLANKAISKFERMPAQV